MQHRGDVSHRVVDVRGGARAMRQLLRVHAEGVDLLVLRQCTVDGSAFWDPAPLKEVNEEVCECVRVSVCLRLRVCVCACVCARVCVPVLPASLSLPLPGNNGGSSHLLPRSTSSSTAAAARTCGTGRAPATQRRRLRVAM
jgi:hypothetical protein